MPGLPPFTARGFIRLATDQASTQSASASSEKKFFRLLCLDDLTLQSFEIGSSPSYIAVSHVWADKVFVDLPHFDSSLGGRAIRAAWAERFPTVKYCWIDNFCILQDNENDKFEQIPLMGDIYRGADVVLIIHACELGLTQVELDEATSGLEEVVELWRAEAPWYDERCQFWRKGEGYAKVERAMRTLARFTISDWCIRVWTLQEFIFARSIVWIGSDLIPLAFEETLFRIIPRFCDKMQLEVLHYQTPDAGFNRFYTHFEGMAATRIAGHDPTRVMEIAETRIASIPVDEVYGAMAASGIQIRPLPEETREEAWMRWCEAAVSEGSLRWLMLPPVATSVVPDATQKNCLFPSASTRGSAAGAASLSNVIPYGPPVVSAGTVTLAARYVSHCRLLRKLGPICRREGVVTFPIHSLILFSQGNWSLAVQIAEAFGSGHFPKDQTHAIASVLVNSFEAALLWWNENLVDFEQVTSSQLEEDAFSAFSVFVGQTLMNVFTASIAYLAVLEPDDKTEQIVAVAIGDRVPAGPLVAFDVNAITKEERTILMIAEAGIEDVKRVREEPDFEMGDLVFHKLGVTIPLRAKIEGPFQQIRVGGSQCPVCRAEGGQMNET